MDSTRFTRTALRIGSQSAVWLLAVDGTLLAALGAGGAVMDLASYVAGRGAFGQVLYQNALTIGVLEAHGLAVLLGLAAVRVASRGQDRFWNLALALAHLLLGVANLAFFDVFVLAQQPAFGAVVTGVHFAFAIAQVLALLRCRHPCQTGTLAPCLTSSSDTAS